MTKIAGSADPDPHQNVMDTGFLNDLHVQMVEEASSREEDVLSLLREELQAKAAEIRSLKVPTV
jgi:hypothetical protein